MKAASTKYPMLAGIGLASALSILCGPSVGAGVPANTVIDVIGGFNRPIGITVSSNSKSVYILSQNQNALYVVDAATDAVIANDIFAGDTPFFLALTPNGKTLYISDLSTAS